jgi:hypothetical protein
MSGAEGLPWYTTHKWASLRHVNGVSVYQEDEGPNGQGGAFMVSAIVRTSPQAVFKVRLLSAPPLWGQRWPV